MTIAQNQVQLYIYIYKNYKVGGYTEIHASHERRSRQQKVLVYSGWIGKQGMHYSPIDYYPPVRHLLDVNMLLKAVNLRRGGKVLFF